MQFTIGSLSFSVSQQVLVVFGSAMAVMVLGFLVALIVYAAMRPRMVLRKRVAAISGGHHGPSSTLIAEKGESRRQKRIQEKVKQLQKESKQRRRSNIIKGLLTQAGIDASIQSFVIASIIVGLLGAIGGLIGGLPPLAIPLVGIGAGFLLPRLILRFIAKRRQKRFTLLFADAIDVLVRGIRSGLPVSECLNIIAREFEDPVGSEFRLMIDGQNLGLTIEDLMRRALERMPTAEFKFFAIVLQIQKQTGGNLADTLAGLSTVLRERKKMQDKIRSMSQEAKSSAAIIASLPFFVMGMLSIVNPQYLMLLFTEDIGNYMLMGGAVWGILGILVMRQMINFDF